MSGSWKDCVTTALLGVEKAGAPPELPASVVAALGGCEEMDREAAFLTRAGALALWRRAGWKPTRDEAVIQPAQPETTEPVSRASAAHLHAMLGGHCTAVLPEWLEEAARRQRHVPPEFLPALFAAARRQQALRPLVAAVGGRRAEWLAAQNPEWTFAAAETPDLWETGSRDQRAAWLAALRLSAPAEARTRVEAVWKTEPAVVRTALLGELATNLSDDDAGFLDGILDDRSKEVRRVALDLLARLPSSPFVARMIARAAPLFSLKRGGLLSRPALEVTLPPEPDAVATRDGLDPKAFGNQKKLGEKAVLLVLILSATPLKHWTDTFQQTPVALLKASEKSEFAAALATGWAWAALRQRDAEWAEALLDGPVSPFADFLPGGSLLSVLPEPARATRLVAALRAGALQKFDSETWSAFAAQLFSFSGYFPPSVATEVLSALRRAAEPEGIPWHLRGVSEALILRIPPALLERAAHGWPAEQEGVAALVGLITFRHEALTALAQP